MGDYSAIAPGTDLPSYARELVQIHDAVISGSRSSLRPRAVVSRSWSRVLQLGLDADGQNPRQMLSVDEVEDLRRASPLSRVIDGLQRVVTSVADASHFLMVVTDADGVILWRKGASAVCRRADSLGFAHGARWTEAAVGTNAIGTALTEAAPVQLFSGEHFEQAQHPWYCTAYPIHDPRTGDLLGIVDVSGPALTLHPAIGALVETAVLLAESQLWQHHERSLEQLRASTAAVLAGLNGPMLVVDRDGWVAHSVGVAARDRVAVPRADKPLAVPGLGVCLPEPVGQGWLVRPVTAGRTITVRLQPGSEPTLEVDSEAGVWRSALSRRHAEILQILHGAGPAGQTARQLSAALFGDVEHVVSVRAEISRLRRTCGAIVTGSPYRISEGVTLVLAGPEA